MHKPFRESALQIKVCIHKYKTKNKLKTTTYFKQKRQMKNREWTETPGGVLLTQKFGSALVRVLRCYEIFL